MPSCHTRHPPLGDCKEETSHAPQSSENMQLMRSVGKGCAAPYRAIDLGCVRSTGRSPPHIAVAPFSSHQTSERAFLAYGRGGERLRWSAARAKVVHGGCLPQQKGPPRLSVGLVGTLITHILNTPGMSVPPISLRPGYPVCQMKEGSRLAIGVPLACKESGR